MLLHRMATTSNEKNREYTSGRNIHRRHMYVCMYENMLSVCNACSLVSPPHFLMVHRFLQRYHSERHRVIDAAHSQARLD